jgi:hypothetical protein
VPKGYVIFNSKVKTENGMTTYFGRNPGAGAYYDQIAVIDTEFTNIGTGTVAASLWSGTAYTSLAGAAEHVGCKFFNVTVASGGALNTTGKNANVNEITQAVYDAEYNGRRAILNRVYQKAGGYAAAGTVWDIDALETGFAASPDASNN